MLSSFVNHYDRKSDNVKVLNNRLIKRNNTGIIKFEQLT